jgi:very-short-patch-repair endonuclease|tara:strand:+ start:3860 stop:4171 length:312 start_codon:yes stop_codon:yes gene_type:complete
MATSKQEQIYNKVVDYYGMADRLIRTVEDSSHKLSQKQFDIVEDLVVTIEKYADEITAKYIEFVKNGEHEAVEDDIRNALNKISKKLDETKNKILILYHDNKI